MKRFFILFFLLFMGSCERKHPESSPAAAPPRALPAIQKIIADLLKRPAEDIRPDATFASLGADDLDFVEIIMATEEALNISIDDDKLNSAAGVSRPDKVIGSLTIQAFAALADGAPRLQPPSPNKEPKDGGLRTAQAGPYGELSKRPNPRGLELVFVPALEELTAFSERKAGRKLTPAELAELKAKAGVIVMPPEDARKLRQKRLERKTGK